MYTTMRCRCCLVTSALGLRSIDEVPDMFVKPRDMLQMFVGLDTKVGQQPDYICYLCANHLTAAHAFYRQCLHAQISFMQPPSTTTKKPTPQQSSVDSPAANNAVRPIQPKPLTTMVSPAPPQANITSIATGLFRCRLCTDLRFDSKHHLAQHRRRQHLHADHSRFCSTCSVQFFTEESYRRHQQLHTDNICLFCNIGFATAADVDEHISVQHNSNTTPAFSRFTCYQCSSAFSSRRALLRHCRRLHATVTATVTYLCGVCVTATFSKRSALRGHLAGCEPTTAAAAAAALEISGADHRLDVAAASAALSFGGLDDDMPVEFLNYSLLGGEDWDDDYCNFDVNYMDGMVEEFLDDAFQLPTATTTTTVLNDLRLSVADDDIGLMRGCGDSSDAEQAAGKQRFDATKHSYRCPRCAGDSSPLPFATKHELDLHLAHEHNEPVLVCHRCGSGFSAMAALMEHRRTQHKVTERRLAGNALRGQMLNRGSSVVTINDDQLLKIVDEPAAKADTTVAKITNTALLCSLCDKSFSTLEDLKSHLLTHTGAAVGTTTKSHRCSYCQRTFSAAISLAAHMRAHHSTAKATHQCEHCELGFATGYQLRRHAATAHGGQRGHVCQVCGKAYTQRSHLRHHEWTHSGTKAFACALCERTFTGRPALRRHIQLTHDI